MATIKYSTVKKEPKKRAYRLAFIFTHDWKTRRALIQAYKLRGFADCWIKTEIKRAKNGASVSIWKIPAAPVAMNLFKKALNSQTEKKTPKGREQLHAFINWLIANSKKTKRNGETAPNVPEKEERTAASMVEKLRKSAYSEKLSAYKGEILDTWTENGEIERLNCAIEKGTLNKGTMTGKELAAKRKNKSTRFARIRK
jgi:hypothetical protein